MSNRERIERILFSLDLGFSDFYKDENVRQLTLQEKLDKIEQCVELKTIEEYMNFSVFSTKGAKHPTAEIYDFALRVFRELVFCYFLAYGRDAFKMNAKEIEILRRHLPESYQHELQTGGIF